MEMRKLGRTGLDVSILGVGGHTYPVGNGSGDFCTLEDRARLIQHLVTAGVNYFDTTWLNEVELLADSLCRANIHQPLNISLQFVDAISDSGWRQKLRKEVESRLSVLGISQTPLFIMGVGNNRPPQSEILAACEALHQLKQEGLVKNIGVSCHDLGAFEKVAAVIEETDLLDYLMIRYNWKFQQAAEKLFPVASAHNVGVVLMKVLCWDCGPDNWGRRISNLEPVESGQRISRTREPNAAQRAFAWAVQNSPCSTTVPSINAMWEADQLLQAVESLDPSPRMDDFDLYKDRLYDRDALTVLSQSAESVAIRQRAAALAGSFRSH